jgi:hypothetical protein
VKGSFRELSEASAIMSRNREPYALRYPKSLRRVLVVAAELPAMAGCARLFGVEVRS